MHLVLANNWLPHRGGSRQYAHELLVRMPPGTFRVITRMHPGADDFDRAQPYAVERIDWPGDGGLAGMARQFNLIRRLIGRVRALCPAMIHAADPFPCGVAARLAGKLCGIPYVIYAHDEPLTPGLRVRTPLERAAFRSAWRVVSASSWARTRLLEEGVAPARIVDLAPAITPEEFRPVADARRGRAPSGLILSLGRMVPHKGFDTLVRAMPAVLAAVPGARLALVGDGPERGGLEALAASLGVAERVAFLGAVDDTVRARLLAEADVFALMSRPRPDGVIREGVGIALLEAAACGIPVIASKLGGLGDSIVEGETGFLLPPDDPAALAALLARLLTGPEVAARMGAAARAHVTAHFAWEGRMPVFRQLLADAPAARP